MKKFKTASTILLAWVAILSASYSFAQGTGDIQLRMISRKAPIVALKRAGVIGENNQGYLAFIDRKAGGANKKLVDAENADRKKVYEDIAKKGKTTADHVGRRRAKQISDSESIGNYIMDARGAWVKKQPKSKK
ncbi:MAG: YdbL family protein [Lentisphaerae bacterium]|jgi:uncharacterized protein YdbL (DUF1318 family)|nr:YdbL family protein [Lentisphaerota bacterium]